MAPRYSAEDLELLTEDERAGLLDTTLIDEGELDPDTEETHEGSDDATAAAAAAAKPEDGADAAAAAKADEDDTQAAPVKAEAAPAAADAPAAAADADLSDIEKAPVAKDSTPDLTAISEQMKDLAKKHDDGEISTLEYEEQRQTLQDKYLDTREARQGEAKRADDAKDTWFNETVTGFLAGKDVYKSEIAFDALNKHVINLQNAAIAEGRNPFSPKILEKAHSRVSQDLQAMGLAPAPARKQAKGETRRELPPAMHETPDAGGAADLEGGEFAHIERLAARIGSDPEAGLKYEEALARLSDDARDRYLAS